MFDQKISVCNLEDKRRKVCCILSSYSWHYIWTDNLVHRNHSYILQNNLWLNLRKDYFCTYCCKLPYTYFHKIPGYICSGKYHLIARSWTHH